MKTRETREPRGISAIERRGILLVYPLANRDEPRSLWSELHPRTPMRWSWDAGADVRVAQMWQLRESLARSLDVVYAKWFRGRATFFSKPVFRAILADLAGVAEKNDLRAGLSREASALLDLLEDDSPQSTKVLRANADLQGRANEPAYARGLKELWSRLLIVGVGEVADGAFPSLQMSATRLRFEDLWPDGSPARPENAEALRAALAESPLFARELDKTRAIVSGRAAGRRVATPSRPTR
jgi:hypothetical protein